MERVTTKVGRLCQLCTVTETDAEHIPALQEEVAEAEREYVLPRTEREQNEKENEEDEKENEKALSITESREEQVVQAAILLQKLYESSTPLHSDESGRLIRTDTLLYEDEYKVNEIRHSCTCNAANCLSDLNDEAILERYQKSSSLTRVCFYFSICPFHFLWVSSSHSLSYVHCSLLCSLLFSV
jgi:hypothetical protein